MLLGVVWKMVMFSSTSFETGYAPFTWNKQGKLL